MVEGSVADMLRSGRYKDIRQRASCKSKLPYLYNSLRQRHAAKLTAAVICLIRYDTAVNNGELRQASPLSRPKDILPR